MHVRTTMTDAILAAFSRAEDPCRRDHLISMLDAISPPDHEEAQSRGDKATTMDEVEYQAWQRREAAKLGLNLDA